MRHFNLEIGKNTTPLNIQKNPIKTNFLKMTKRVNSKKVGLLSGTSMAMVLTACGGSESGSSNDSEDKSINISSNATGIRLFSFDTLTEQAEAALSSVKGVDLQTSNIQNLNITTTDGASILKSLSGEGLEKVTVAGDQDVTIENFADSINPNIDIDARALTGDMQVVLSSRGNSNVIGGIGADVITILGNFNNSVYSDNEQINSLANNLFLEIPSEFGGGQFDLVRPVEGNFSLGDGNDKVVSYGSLSSSGLTLEGVETLEIHSLFTTNSFFLKHWGGNDIIFAGSQDHTLRIQIVEDPITGEYITDIDLNMITVAQGNLNIEIYGPPGLTLDSTYDISEVYVISPASSQIGIEVFPGNRELLVEPNDIISNQQYETIFIKENHDPVINLNDGFLSMPWIPDISNQNSDGTTKYTWDYMHLFNNPNKEYPFTTQEAEIHLEHLKSNIVHVQYSADLPTLDQNSNSYTLSPELTDRFFTEINLSFNNLDYETQEEFTVSFYDVLPGLYNYYIDFKSLDSHLKQYNYNHDLKYFFSGGGVSFTEEAKLKLKQFSDKYANWYSSSFADIHADLRLIEVPIVILNVDEVAPIITSPDVVSIADNSEAGATIYTVTSTDNEDISDGVTYSITDGGDKFSVNAETGAVNLNSEIEAGEYSFVVKATDGQNNSVDRNGVETLQHIKTVTVTVTEADNTPPTIASLAPITLAENTALGTTVATITASDDGGALTYSLDESSPSIFAIDSLSGVITLTAELDYETDQQYAINVIASDPAGNQSQSPLSIIVGNIDEAAPTIAAEDIISISEDTIPGSSVNISLTINDDDEILDGETASLNYSLVGLNRSDFVINEDTGAIIIGSAGLDFETTPFYNLKVRVTDQAGNISETDAIEIRVTDVLEEPPLITSSLIGTLNSPIPAANVGNAIYTITAEDPDHTASELTYSISNNPGSIRVNSDTGEIFLNAAPGFSVSFDMDAITFDATVTDPMGLFDTVSINIDILSANTGGYG